MISGKVCTRCKTKKPKSAFSSNGSNGLRSRCKSCRVDIMRMRKFNLTEDQLLELMKINNCKICGKEVEGKDKCIDHCHTTGKVRGILCSNCNYGLGQFYDDPELLKQAINYLKDVE